MIKLNKSRSRVSLCICARVSSFPLLVIPDNDSFTPSINLSASCLRNDKCSSGRESLNSSFSGSKSRNSPKNSSNYLSIKANFSASLFSSRYSTQSAKSIPDGTYPPFEKLLILLYSSKLLFNPTNKFHFLCGLVLVLLSPC